MSIDGDKTRQEILDCIRAHWKQHGFGPSARDISDAVGILVSAVQVHLGILAGQNRIRREPHKARSIRVLEPDENCVIECEQREDGRRVRVKSGWLTAADMHVVVAALRNSCNTGAGWRLV